jgi:energy-coupling factor transporter transmembrane protein EcfT
VVATPRRQWSSGRSMPPRLPFPVKLLIALVVVVLVFTHLPWVLVGLLVYLVFLRRVVHHHHPRHPRWR